MLVERNLQTVGWKKSDLEELKEFDTELFEEYNKFKNTDYNRLTLDETARFTKIGNKIEIELYDDVTYDELCKNLKDDGFSLPSLDEWEYLYGGGCNICGGSGIFLSYLPCSPYYNQEAIVDEYDKDDNELHGDFDFYRRIIRIEE